MASFSGAMPGALADNGDLGEAEEFETLDDAQTRALELVGDGCKGFTFQSAQGTFDDGSVWVIFKDHFDYSDNNDWTSYQIVGGKDEDGEDSETTPMLPTRADGETTTMEPFWLRPFVSTTNVFDGIGLQTRPGDGVYDIKMSEGQDEEDIGTYQCTQAIITSYCGVLTCGVGECCTHRSESTHTLKLTSKRVQISMDEAEGCWPTTDEDNPSIGNPICGCCCMAPSGCIQTKVMGLLDIAGYAREVTVPKVQILGSMRFALSCWAFVVVLAYCATVLTTEEGQTAANGVATNVANSVQSALNSSNMSLEWVDPSVATAQPGDLSTLPLVLTGLALVAFLAMILYLLLDQVLKYGWKFVALMTLLCAPIGVFVFMNVDMVIEHLMSPEMAAHYGPYNCLLDVFAKAGLAAATLPLWIFLAWCYIVCFGVRQYNLRVNFANQVTYTLTMKRADIDTITQIFSRRLQTSNDIVEAVDVPGAGLLDSEVDMPVCLPGQQLKSYGYPGGGGLVLTNVALGTHTEAYSFFCCGPEIYQLSEVYIHSPIIQTTLMTKLEFTTNLMPRKLRRLFYFLGTLFLIGGITLAVRDFTAPQFGPDGVTATGAPMRYPDGTPRMGVFLSIFALFVIAFPKLTGCVVSKVLIDFTWGTIVLFLTLPSEEAEDLMTWLITASCNPGEYIQPDGEYEEILIGEFTESEAQSCLSPIRKLQVTTMRIKIQDDKTSISYMRSGLTECDMGPEQWGEKCFGVCPISGWQRPNREASASLSLNFGWLKGIPQDSFPGTNLEMTERLTFSYEDCMQICQTLDQPFGKFIHHVWSPVMHP